MILKNRKFLQFAFLHLSAFQGIQKVFAKKIRAHFSFLHHGWNLKIGMGPGNTTHVNPSMTPLQFKGAWKVSNLGEKTSWYEGPSSRSLGGLGLLRWSKTSKPKSLRGVSVVQPFHLAPPHLHNDAQPFSKRWPAHRDVTCLDGPLDRGRNLD